MDQINHDGVSEALCELIFTNEDDFHENERKSLLNILVFCSSTSVHAPYDKITKKVFEYNDFAELKLLPQSVQERLDGIDIGHEADNYSNDKFYHFKEDIIRHVNLSVTQKLSIEKASKEALKRAEKANKILKKTKNMKKNIYTDFITILGIFTAITFATFGGLQLLGNVYGNANTDSLKSIGGIIFLGANYVFGVYLILIVLLTGIKKLTSGKKEYVPSKFVLILVLGSCLFMLMLGFSIYLFGYFLSS